MINFETRLRIITGKLNDFLRQFRVPEQLDDQARLIRLRATAEAINRRISTSSGPDDLADRVDDAFRRVIESHRGREWPSVADFVKAMEDTLPATRLSATSSEMVDWARRLWFHGNPENGVRPKTCIPPANTWEIAQVLISEGADPWELRYGGFETDTAYFQRLEDEGRGWSGHDAKMADLRDIIQSSQGEAA